MEGTEPRFRTVREINRDKKRRPGQEKTMATKQTRRLLRGMRHAVIALFILMVLIVTFRSALALGITGVTAPATIMEGQTLNLSFTAEDATGYAILQDGVTVSNNNTYKRRIGYDEAGTHDYEFRASDGTSTTSENRTVTIVNVPLTVTIEEPAASDYEQQNIPVAVSTNIPTDLCYAATSQGTNTLNRIDNTTYNGTVTLPDGVQTMTVVCTRNSEEVTANTTIHIDTTPPEMTLGPSGTLYDNAVTLSATTDEASDCRYDTTTKPYAQMTERFPETASLTHQQELSLGSGSYSYSVSCEDVYGNAAEPRQITFTVQNPPSATVSVEGDNPHKAGTYKVTLTVSEPLAGMPTLTLTYQGSTSQTLALDRVDDTTYEGYLIVGTEAGEKVGSFRFSGKDRAGLTGTMIRDGGLFRVDTVKPAKVDTFKAVNGTGGVNLTWYYGETGDDVSFNIYRSTQPGVDYTEYLTSATGDTYMDFNTHQAVKYYYRIAAMDAAGNVGDLSHEEWASPAAATYHAQEIAAALDPVLQVGLDKRLDELEIWIMDAQRTATDLGAETDKVTSSVIRDLGLLSDAQQAVKTMGEAKTGLQRLRTLALTKEQFDSRVTAIDEQVSTARKMLTLNVKILQKASYQEVPEQTSIDAAVSTIFKDGGNRDAYLNEAATLQTATSIQTSVTQAAISYADGSEQEYTIISKELSVTEPQQDVVAIETVPKELAATASDLTYIGSQPVVLKQDPILQYTYNALTQGRIAYAVKRAVDPAIARGATLVLLPKPTQEANSQQTEPNSAPTGMAILSSLSSLGGGQLFLAIIGLVIVAGLLIYYFSLRNDGDGWPFGQAAGDTQGMPVPGVSFTAGIAPGMLPRGTSGVAPPFAPFTPSGPAGFSHFNHFSPSNSSSQARPHTIVIERRQEPLAGLLSRSHALIDTNRYLDALYFYKRAVERYEQEPFPSAQLKEATRQEIELLHAKLSLFDTTAKAHDAAYAEDATQLAQLMERMRTLAVVVGEQESGLVTKAKSAYEYLYRQLNGLQMEAKRS